MTNKEAVERLQTYFLTQNFETVARIAANFLLDFHRLQVWEDIPEEERNSLIRRMDKNEHFFLSILMGKRENDFNVTLVDEPSS